ncbi:MAG TPA: hypothetical protein VMW50_02655 [Dehalococcoidia bacterium]|nr:hypothetical protein [Dehalococcoidia bacterium]
MKIILSSKRHHYLSIVSIFLIAVALIAGMVGCTGQYRIQISSGTGGTVTTPGEGLFSYAEGTVVNLVAKPDAGYQFANWTGNVDTMADAYAASTTITMNNNYYIIARFDCSNCGG